MLVEPPSAKANAVPPISLELDGALPGGAIVRFVFEPNAPAGTTTLTTPSSAVTDPPELPMTAPSRTLTSTLDDLPSIVAVIDAFPMATPDTRPAETVAFEISDDDHVAGLSVIVAPAAVFATATSM